MTIHLNVTHAALTEVIRAAIEKFPKERRQWPDTYAGIVASDIVMADTFAVPEAPTAEGRDIALAAIMRAVAVDTRVSGVSTIDGLHWEVSGVSGARAVVVADPLTPFNIYLITYNPPTVALIHGPGYPYVEAAAEAAARAVA